MVVFPSVAGVRNRGRSFRLERQNKLLQLAFPEFYSDHKLIFTEFQPEFEKEDYFFQDLVHGTSVTGGWTGKVGNLSLFCFKLFTRIPFNKYFPPYRITSST